MTVQSFKAHLGGAWIGSGDEIDVHDPADWTKVIGRVPALNAAQVTTAFEGARVGAGIWGATNPIERGRVLFRAAGLLRERSETLALLLSRENGKTVAEATVEVAKAADFFEYFAGFGRQPLGEIVADERSGTVTTVRHEPVGVVLAITPWNDPLLTPARKMAPALAMGNSVVLKPASDTPMIAIELTRVLLEAGLPPEVITTVTGKASEIAEALVASPEIDAITFTGSTEVGLAVHRQVAGRNLRVQCEMGGKNAAIVLADADIELAAQTIAAAAFAQGGQRCTATSRVLVEPSVKEALIARLVEHALAMSAGRGSDEGTTLGPLVNPHHQMDVLDHVATAIGEGARVRAGGTRPVDGTLSDGCFVLPTILDEVTTDMSVWSTEIFGPVVAVVGCGSLAEAVKIANDSDYGLSASLFTSSLAATDEFLRGINTGQAAVNLPTSGWDVHQPFGGFKLSGSPFKEQGHDALGFYTRTKTCAVRSI
ncbi:MAG: aldehyde dehydrogenase family protein [Actinomycetota bacterium]|nr:aldehyde dehydrogenase family protein [Actinomycetota bacterium]